MGNWTIRRAVHDDADPLSACIDAAYAQYAARISDLPPLSADCADEIAQHQVWVAEIGKDIVGGLVMIPMEGFMQLANVAVHPNHRGIGLGRALIALAEREALEHGYRQLHLTTHRDMPENIALYERLGWQLENRQDAKVSMKKTV
jgi:ribosomal protein S18 acetylase RimI-like enzyme